MFIYEVPKANDSALCHEDNKRLEPQEHIREVERSKRTIKEETQCHTHICPYTRYPMLIILGCGKKTIKKLNHIPSEKVIIPYNKSKYPNNW